MSKSIDSLSNCPELTAAALAKVPRQALEHLLRVVSTAEVYVTPWDTTCILAGDRWGRIEAAALACLERVPGLKPVRRGEGSEVGQ